MGTHSSATGLARRRGARRAAALSLAALAASLLALGCGGGDDGADVNPEKGSDAEILDESLARELTLLDAYTRGRPLLRGPMRPVGRGFRAQQQEYVDAIGKALRGLGARAEARPEALDLSGVDDQAGLLRLAHELESAALAAYVDAAPRLHTDAPRTLAASLAAGHAQHLVLLRQGLGAAPAEAVREGFDGGVVPAPGAAAD